MSTRTFMAAVPVVVASLAFTACGGGGRDGGADDDTGVATAAITNVPADVGCIEITVTGNRTVDRKFDVLPGQSSILSLAGLPVGSVSFLGQAFDSACSSVGSASVPTWLSDPVPATLVSAVNSNVTLPLHKNGKSTVSVDFDDDGGVDASTTVCMPGTADCNGSPMDGCEVNVSTNPSNCGACGNVCATGTSCVSGACVAPMLAPLGAACTTNSMCMSGNCVDGICCNTACTGLCQACNLAGSVGTCSNVPFGMDPANECVGASNCSGMGTCTP